MDLNEFLSEQTNVELFWQKVKRLGDTLLQTASSYHEEGEVISPHVVEMALLMAAVSYLQVNFGEGADFEEIRELLQDVWKRLNAPPEPVV